MKAWTRSLLVLASAALLSPASVIAQDTAPPEYVVQTTWHIGGPGRWDYATFDPDAHRLYVTRSTHTQGIDVETGKVVVDINGQKRSHGTAIVTAANRGFISDGEDGSVVVFDLKTAEVQGKVKADDDADGIIYDPGTDRVLTACGDAQKLIVLDPKVDLKDAKASSVDLGGKPEFLAADGAGKAYVNLNDQNQIAVVDIKNLSVINKWSTAPGERPTGLAIDPAHHLLFIGCRNQKLIIMSTDDGHVVQDFPIGKGNDACKFDPGTGEAFASCGDGTITMVKQNASGKFDASTIQTKPAARTMAVDPATHTLYLPTAEMEAPPTGGGRPAMKPDTFMIVVVAPVKQ